MAVYRDITGRYLERNGAIVGMNQVVVQCAMVGDGTQGNPIRPQFNVDFPQADYNDISVTDDNGNDIPPVTLLCTMSDADLATMQANPAYTSLPAEPIPAS